MNRSGRTVLWWGRFDPDYSRNRILRQAYIKLGWQVADFHPVVSPLGDFEARLRQPPQADLVHVPCFRQRDLNAAARYARRHHLPLLFDPLISAFDKQVYERRKVSPCTTAARQLLHEEQQQFANADIVLADTPEHARFFAEILYVAPEKLQVVYVGAEDSLFRPLPHEPRPPLEVLFYGSFIPLQGPQVIIEAARLYQGPPVRWTLLGNGPLKRMCHQDAAMLDNVTFEDWVAYDHLPVRMARADILLGVFGNTPKALRVIPNKVFQGLACGKPLITGAAPAYPDELRAELRSGITWVPMNDPAALATAVAGVAAHPDQLVEEGLRARATYERFFASAVVTAQLDTALASLRPEPG